MQLSFTVKTWLCALLASTGSALSQLPETPVPTTPPTPTVFPHPDAARYFIAGQANIIFQAHAPFHSPYQGANSVLPRGEYKASLLGTLYLGYQLNPSPRYATEALLNVESSGGRGISEALGLAGFTNLDVVRNPSLGSKPYLARYFLHQVIGLTSATQDSPRTFTSLATRLPIRRFELQIGRMSLPDFLDLNVVGTDSHLQFLNWTADNNGAWDYAANTRGYTDAAVLQYVDHAYTARYAFAAMPTVANGTDLSYKFHQAAAQNVELERRQTFRTQPGAIRILGFVNRANMGVYRTQNALVAGTTLAPVITAHPLQRTYKYGVGVNVEQQLYPSLRSYARFGWNEGQHESYAYTEVDQTVAAGADYAFTRLHRPNDKLGLTFISNAVKRDHQYYLAHGGQGFLLGDGHLTYAREQILESYYNVSAGHGLYFALDAQYITNPGYNQARGPVLVEAVRTHIDF